MTSVETDKKNTAETDGNLAAPYQSWEDSLVAVKKTRLTKPRTVALCGFAGNTRHLAPYDRRNVEIWGINEAYNHDFMKNSKGEFRVDRWIQIHKYEDWSRRNNPNDERHPEWMRSEHNYPIYTQEVWDDVPNSVKYPLDEIDKMFEGVFVVDPVTGKNRPWIDVHLHGYYTSSFAWVMALAIHEGFERIEVWGFNMGSQSEYLYQKASGEFWVGMAMGRGIEIVFPEQTPILLGNLYGYEFGQIVQIKALEERIGELKNAWQPRYQSAAFTAGRRMQVQTMQARVVDDVEMHSELQVEQDELFYEEIEKTTDVNFHSGATAELESMISFIKRRHPDDPKWTSTEGWVDRLALEVRIRDLRQAIRRCRELLNKVSGAKLEIFRLIEEGADTPELNMRKAKLMQHEINVINRLNRYLGAWTTQKLLVLNMDQRTRNAMDDFDLGARTTLAPDTQLDVLELTMEEDDEVGEDDNSGEEDPPEES